MIIGHLCIFSTEMSILVLCAFLIGLFILLLLGCKSPVGFPGGSVVKNLPANAGDSYSISGWGRSPREGNVNPLQYSCLGNPSDRGNWQATAHGVAKSPIRLSD